MNRLEIVKEQIRCSVSITEMVERLTGQKFVKGKMRCPFHNEKTASFGVTENKGMYYCFGCGAGGDMFDFVMKDQGLNFSDAVKFIDREFALGLMDGKISVAAQIAVREHKKKKELEQKQLAENSALYNKLCARFRINTMALKALEPLSDAWCECIWKRDWLEYALDEVMCDIK